jgi:hypothetical protein
MSRPTMWARGKERLPHPERCPAGRRVPIAADADLEERDRFVPESREVVLVRVGVGVRAFLVRAELTRDLAQRALGCADDGHPSCLGT